MRSAQVRCSLVLLTVLAAACGGGGSNESAVERGSLSNAVASGAACTEADLTVAGSCAGPWTYDTFRNPCYAKKATPHCGEAFPAAIDAADQAANLPDSITAASCTRWNQCRNSCFGTTRLGPNPGTVQMVAGYHAAVPAGYGGNPPAQPAYYDIVYRNADSGTACPMTSGLSSTKAYSNNLQSFCNAQADAQTTARKNADSTWASAYSSAGGIVTSSAVTCTTKCESRGGCNCTTGYGGSVTCSDPYGKVYNWAYATCKPYTDVWKMNFGNACGSRESFSCAGPTRSNTGATPDSRCSLTKGKTPIDWSGYGSGASCTERIRWGQEYTCATLYTAGTVPNTSDYTAGTYAWKGIPSFTTPCRRPAHGEAIGECGTQGVIRYSGFGVTRASLGNYAAGASCLTGDDIDTIYGKFHTLKTTYENAGTYASSVDVVQLRTVAVSKLKLLLELHGTDSALTDAQREEMRNYVLRLYETRPDARASCGNNWVSPGGSYTKTIDFNDLEPLALDSDNAAEAVVVPADALQAPLDGSPYLQLGRPTTASGVTRVRTDIGVPAAGGSVSFWWRNTCAGGASDGASAWVLDNTTQQSVSLLSSTCTSTGTWSKIEYDLSAFAGHVVTLYLSNTSSATGTYTQIDNIVFSTWPVAEDAALQACQRALALDPAGAVLFQEKCMDGASVGALPASYSHRAEYVDQFRADTLALFSKVQGRNLVPVQEGQINAELQRRLALVHRWFRKASLAAGQPSGLYGEQNGRDLLFSDLSRIVMATWEGIYAPDHVKFESSPKTSANVQDYAAGLLARDREVIRALFSPMASTQAFPVTSQPALYFVADAFRGVQARLDSLAPYHDFGCRFLECKVNSLKTEITELYRMMGTLHDPTAFAAAIQGARNAALASTTRDYFAANPANWSTYLGVMDLIAAHHADVIQPAVLAGAGVAGPYQPSLVITVPEGASLPLIDFANFVQASAARASAFDKNGVLLRDGVSPLRSGLLAGKISDLDTRISNALTTLQQSIDDYRGAESTTIASLINQIDSNVQEDDIDTRWLSLEQRALALAEDDNALRVGGAVDRIRFADYTSDLRAIDDTLADKMFTASNTRRLEFRGGDGNYTGGTLDSILSVAKYGNGVDYPADGIIASGTTGEVLTFDVGGYYQPTCSLNAALAGGSFKGIPTDTTGLSTAKTGSTGFALSFTNQKYNVTSVTDTTTDTTFVTVQACASASVPYPVSAKVEACVGYSHSEAHAEMEGEGTQGASTAAFSLGLRLPNTPFPQYPVGALLAVQMKHGQTAYPGGVLDIQVVGEPRASMVLIENADVYLVVNDARCSAPNSEVLTAYVTKLTPAANQMQQVATAIGSLNDPNATTGSPGAMFQAKVNAMLAQGALLPDDISSLKNDAWQALRLSCSSCDVDAFPGIMKGYFEIWVDNQIRTIERRIQQRGISREVNLLLLENDSLKRELELLADKGRLVDLLPRLSLRNLEYANDQLKYATDQIRYLVSEELHPMVYLRYPEVLVGLQNPKKLLALNWVSENLGNTGDALSLAGKMYQAVKEVQDRLDDAVWTSKQTGTDLVQAYAVVRFPNPWHPPEDIADPYTTFPGKAADAARSRGVWRPILDYFNGCPVDQGVARCAPLKFSVLPTDVYKSGITNGSLGCKLVAPSIVTMGFFLASTDEGSSDNRNQGQNLVPVNVAPDMLFATARGLEPFLFDNTNWTATPRVKVMYGKGDDIGRWRVVFEDLLKRFPVDFAQSVSGVSPFTSYTVETLEDYGDPWYRMSGDPDPYTYLNPTTGLSSQRTTDFIVIMLVEARQKDPGVKGVLGCN